MKRHLALVGFMAAGKSTIGRRLARRLHCAFFDTDALVVREHGAIDEIFAQEGEDAFRRYEREAIARVLEGESAVVALGGGALTVGETRGRIARDAHSVFLKVSPQEILERVRHGASRRPLLGSAPTLAQICLLYEKRLPDYTAADHTVDAHLLSDRAVIDDILAWLREQKIEFPR